VRDALRVQLAHGRLSARCRASPIRRYCRSSACRSASPTSRYARPDRSGQCGSCRHPARPNPTAHACRPTIRWSCLRPARRCHGSRRSLTTDPIGLTVRVVLIYLVCPTSGSSCHDPSCCCPPLPGENPFEPNGGAQRPPEGAPIGGILNAASRRHCFRQKRSLRCARCDFRHRSPQAPASRSSRLRAR
jgi:hypothetical protein